MQNPNTSGTGNAVNSVVKAMQILNCFTPNIPTLSLAQISKQLDIPKSTTLNLIKTLESGGMILRVKDSNSYQLGYKNMELGFRTLMGLSVLPYAIPIMEEIQEKTGEIIYLTSHLNGLVFYLQCIYPSRPKVSYSVMGKTLPMHCTGCGKAMLSYLEPAAVDKIIERYGLAAVTPYTITDTERLFKELDLNRQRGYATDNQEETLGVKCVAVAIRNTRGVAVGALSLSGSIITLTPDKYDLYADLLSKASILLSQQANLFPASQMNQA